MRISNLISLHKCSALVNLEIFVSLVKNTSGLPFGMLDSSNRKFSMRKVKLLYMAYLCIN